MKKQLVLLGCLLLAITAWVAAEDSAVVVWTDGGYLLNTPADEPAWHGFGGGGEVSLELPLGFVPVSIQIQAGYRADVYALPAAVYGEDSSRAVQMLGFGVYGKYWLIPRLYFGGGIGLSAFIGSSADIGDMLMILSPEGGPTAMGTYVTAKAGYLLLDRPRIQVPAELRINAGLNAPSTFPMELILAVGVAIKT